MVSPFGKCTSRVSNFPISPSNESFSSGISDSTDNTFYEHVGNPPENHGKNGFLPLSCHLEASENYSFSRDPLLSINSSILKEEPLPIAWIPGFYSSTPEKKTHLLFSPSSTRNSFSFPLPSFDPKSQLSTPHYHFIHSQSDLKTIERKRKLHSKAKSNSDTFNTGFFQCVETSTKLIRKKNRMKFDTAAPTLNPTRTKSRLKSILKYIDPFSDSCLRSSSSSSSKNSLRPRFKNSKSKHSSCLAIEPIRQSSLFDSLNFQASFFPCHSKSSASDSFSKLAFNAEDSMKECSEDVIRKKDGLHHSRSSCLNNPKANKNESSESLHDVCLKSESLKVSIVSRDIKQTMDFESSSIFSENDSKQSMGEKTKTKRIQRKGGIEGSKENLNCDSSLQLIQKFLPSSDKLHCMDFKKSTVDQKLNTRPASRAFSRIDSNSNPNPNPKPNPKPNSGSNSNSNSNSIIESALSKSSSESSLSEDINVFLKKPLLGSLPSTSNFHIFHDHPSPMSLSSFLNSFRLSKKMQNFPFLHFGTPISTISSQSFQIRASENHFDTVKAKVGGDPPQAKRSKDRKTRSNIQFENLPYVPKYTQYQMEELKLATNDFSERNVIGQGGYGKVFKGILPILPETKVAIKFLKNSQESNGQLNLGNDEFKNELYALGRLHHRNLVKLYGFCTNSEQRLLVYQFVANGSLHDHLHGKKLHQNGPLSWKKRIKIAKDISRGISHLHFQNPRILHRDLKSSNILLTSNYRAKVADFGCAKTMKRTFAINSKGGLKEKRSVEFIQFGFGTIGHIAPEMSSAGEISSATDIFSFGVILLELLTGRKPVERNLKTPRSLISWSVPLIKSNKWQVILDPFLLQALGIPELWNSPLVVFARLAASCLHENPTSRPSADTILRLLNAIGCSDGAQPIVGINGLDLIYLDPQDLVEGNFFAMEQSSESEKSNSS